MLETSSISKDVPYGDNFTVDSLITISAEGESACVLKLASRVKFTKSVWGISGTRQSVYWRNSFLIILQA